MDPTLIVFALFVVGGAGGWWLRGQVDRDRQERDHRRGMRALDRIGSR